MHIERHEMIETVWGLLIDEVQPVVIEKVGVAAPDEARLFLRIVVGVVIFRQADGKALLAIPLIFPFQCAQVILEVAEDEDAAGLLVGNDIDAVLGRVGEDGELRCLIDFPVIDGGVAGLRDEVAVVKAAEERVVIHCEAVLVDAEELVGEDALLYPIVTVEPCLRRPTEMQGGEDVGIRPFEVFHHLRPVLDFFVGHLFDRRAGDDEAIVFLILDVIESEIVLRQVGAVCVGGLARCDTGESTESCSGVSPKRRSSCTSVGFLMGIRFRIRIFSGRISCVRARASLMVTIPSFFNSVMASRPSAILIGKVKTSLGRQSSKGFWEK